VAREVRTWVSAALLLVVPGCANIWGFNDLTLGPDGSAGGDDASLAPDGGHPGTGGDGSSGGDAEGGTGGDCGSTDTIINCGACGNVCDNNQSFGAACDGTKCTYKGCADGWQNCDTSGADTNGCETSMTSTAACGGCGNSCDMLHSIGAMCTTAADAGIGCHYSGCEPGWADCDTSGEDLDGCETSLATATNCGACGVACDKTQSQGASCPDGKTCIYTGCNSGFADCDTSGADTNGCETSVPANTCDACGMACDMMHSEGASCDTTGTATCKYTSCDANFADCNTSPPDTDGCETSTTTITNCGNCGVACDTTNSVGATCAGNTCKYSSCAAGFADCFPAAPNTNGCESSLTSTTSCGGCGNACNTKTGTPQCSGSTCSYKCNAGLLDCNAATKPDVDGCECQGTACCGTGCQTAHSDGLGQTFYDCTALGTYKAPQAMEACTAATGGNGCKDGSMCCGGIGALGLCIGTTYSAVCNSSGGSGHCWEYDTTNPGAVLGGGSLTCSPSPVGTWN
jgi:hypothetical protein